MNLSRCLFGTPVVAAVGLAMGAGVVLAQDIRFNHAQGEITLDSAPQRIAVFDLPSLDIINALGKSDLVVAVPRPADGPANFPDHLALYDDARFAPAGTLFEPDAEALQAIGPDLIILGGRSRTAFEAMGEIAPTIDMTIQGDDRAADVIADTERLGSLLGAEDAAATRIEAFRQTIAETREAGAEAGTGLVLFGAGQGFSVQAPGARFGTVYELVGIEPVVSPVEPDTSPRPEPGSPEAEAARQRQNEALEAALAANPDWIFTLDRNAAVGNSDAEPLTDRLAADPRVTATNAWQSGQVVALDARNWYILNGGIDAMSASAEAIGAAFAAAAQ